jgi:transposase
MQEGDIITMSQKELRRLNVIHKVIDNVITQVKAAELLNLSTKQVRRIEGRVTEEGDEGIIHKSRGRSSPRAFPDKRKRKALALCETKYEGFGPTLASEKLFEIDKIKISRETLRGWFKEKGIIYTARKKRPHRNWRERKHLYGEMEQVDGSHHDWFEGRGPECVLMGYIDDANSRVYAEFHDYEGTLPFMASFKNYVKKYGLPQNVYIDRHPTYKSTKESTIEDELHNREPMSQVQRALHELEVDITFAHSAPAKGRIERLFRTFQDRLVKEMRLRGIKSVKEANKFLKYYLPIYNKRFMVEPIEQGDLHTPLPKDIDLDRILCKKTKRGLNKDSTVAHDKKLYHVPDKVYAKKVMVEERTDGKLYIMHCDNALKYKEITSRPARKEIKKPYVFKLKRVHIPPKDHPWRKFKINSYPQSYTYSQKEKVAQKEKELLLTKT